MRNLKSLILISALNGMLNVFPDGAQKAIVARPGHGQIFKKIIKKPDTSQLERSLKKQRNKSWRRYAQALESARHQPISGHWTRRMYPV